VHNLPVHGLLSRRQRLLAWLAFFALAVQAPFSARLLPDASWLFSLVVAGMVAVLILADDVERRRRPRPEDVY
jgi:hypothetical protein